MQPYALTPENKTCDETCPLSSEIKRQVTTEVHGKNINVMFVAEAPGRTENEKGRPVIGLSGKILRRVVLQLNNGSEEGVAYGNVVRCRPTQEVRGIDKDRAPSPREVACCKNNVLLDIQRLRPKQVVICGRSAAYSIALDARTKKAIDPKTPITKLRGLDYIVRTPDGSEFPATITFHFAYVNRNPLSGSVFKEDIAKIFMRVNSKVKDYSKRGKPVRIIKTLDEVYSFLGFMVKKLNKKTVVAMDYETVGADRIDNTILTVGFAFRDSGGIVIPYQHKESPWDRKEFIKLRKMLRKFFSTQGVSFRSLVCHNLKFECAVTLDQLGVYLNAFGLEDTMLRAHGLNENRKDVLGKAFGLKRLSDEWLGFKGYEDPDIAPIVELRNQGRLAEAPLEPLCEYNAMDCYVTQRLYKVQDAVADAEWYKDKLTRLGTKLHGRISAFASAMENNGARVDKERIRYLMSNESPILQRQWALANELYSMESTKMANKLLLASNKKTTGMEGIWESQQKGSGDPWEFHINKQKSKEALYIRVLDLAADKTKTGKPSIGKPFFAKHKGVREVDILAEWTALDKLRGTYINGIYKLLQTKPDMRDGRVRSSFWFHNTATSRTSSDSPNMQNIPKGKTETAKAIKSLFIVDDGNIMVCADYSQAEVRWLAEMTGDKNLIRAFKNVAKVQAEYAANPTEENFIKMMMEGDFHRQTAGQIFGKPPQEVQGAERGAAKAIVFGLIYGMSAFGLSTRLGISKAEAEAYQDKFLNQFPDARKWLEWIEGEGFKRGYVESPIGRRRHLVSNYVMGSDNAFFLDREGARKPTEVGRFKSYEDRVCRNAPIQSIASDTNLMACVNIQNFIVRNKKNWKLINIVHDSIIAEIPFPEVREYIEVTDKIMTDPDIFKDFGIRLEVPFKSDFTVGANWGQQIEVDIVEEYKVLCLECGKSRKEKKEPTNLRCEECGSRSIDVEITSGTLDKALDYLDEKNDYSTFWKQEAV